MRYVSRLSWLVVLYLLSPQGHYLCCRTQVRICIPSSYTEQKVWTKQTPNLYGFRLHCIIYCGFCWLMFEISSNLDWGWYRPWTIDCNFYEVQNILKFRMFHYIYKKNSCLYNTIQRKNYCISWTPIIGFQNYISSRDYYHVQNLDSKIILLYFF